MNYFFVIALCLFIFMNFWFVVSLVKKRNDVADMAWGLGFVFISWISFLIAENFEWRSLIVNTLVSVWGVRLAWHIYIRNKGRSEDYRYLAWRKEWGKWFYLRSYVQVYLLQGFLLYIIGIPILLINKYSQAPFGWTDIVGVVVWLTGFFFEVVGDAQLAQFIKNPSNKGKLMKSGLWAYTRHPNYFGEVTLWWGIWIISLSDLSLISIVGPLTITFLILKVSGIPMLEKRMAENPEFLEYSRRVSVFFPLPPRNYD